MKKYERERKLKQHKVIPKKEMKMPIKNIPVRINSSLVVYTDNVDKIPSILERYSK